MTILVSKGCDVYTYPCPHDKDESKYYYLKYKPATWEIDKVYIKSTDIVLPTVETGFMFKCVSGGRSDVTTEPVFPTVENETIDDGTVKWKAVPYDALMGFNDIITTSTWQVEEVGTLIDSFSLDNNFLVGFRLYEVPVDATEVTVTNVIVITKPDGKEFTYNRSIKFTIKEL
ncbi:MAG: hypothetical protein DRI46_10880 [Chloroflexi bacterium]|nr:MAG: hypothetical protein DRI46_10880 [Chloroflexota bacterium]